MNFVDYLELNRRSNPDQIAIRTETNTWTYEELVRDVRRFANVLQSDGISSESHVAVMLPNTYEFAVALFGSLARNQLTGLIDPRSKRGELETLITQMDPAAIVTTAENADSVREIDQSISVYCTEAGDGVGQDFWEQTEAASAEFRVPETLGEEEALMLHTSGSTGQPKAVVHTHGSFIAVSDLATISYELHSDTTHLAALPLYHCWGLMNLGATLKIGGEIVLMNRWNPEEAMERIDEYGIDFFSGVPAMYKDLMASPQSDQWQPTSLEVAITGGARVPSELIPDAEALLECPVFNGWGMTETFAAGVWEEPSQERRIPSVGTSSDRLFEVKVIDQEDGSELPSGEAGELLVRGDAVMKRYLGQPSETSDVFSGEWLRTGDIARIDQDGYVYLQDREKYMIITGGENIYPQEVEDVIEELDGVRNAVVVAKPDERKGEKPVAFVERTDQSELTEAEIKSHCLDQLAAFKHPRTVTFIDDPPRNSVGKIQRTALEEEIVD
ncbi:class I adenylate-forming enzyme family protein [Natrinema halophilum]|uniref:Acyl--CoA ligase n=1 Tax=Natrinema halophilum TaxID=1699371 RepID=A0A7D5GUM5_9EURY|nr:class I adenylate-forming enzyme family protein [Natrinema halophilum]QLG50206.1 acyl--CoA ligase [Natrinema halophilum]